VDALKNKVGDMYEKQVFEPLSVKVQVIKSATEAASMLLRIDDVIAASKPKGGPGGGMGGPGGGMGGPGGMGGMGGPGGMGGMED
jgi:chaperonin GroEL (HSP60 family)